MNFETLFFTVLRVGADDPLHWVGMRVFKYHGLLEAYDIDINLLDSFLREIEGLYHPSNPYHNNYHAADVVRTRVMTTLSFTVSGCRSDSDVLVDVEPPSLTLQKWLERVCRFFISCLRSFPYRGAFFSFAVDL